MGRSGRLESERVKEAERYWWVKIQEDQFHQELIELRLGKSVKEDSILLQLKPYIDDFGIIRARGRIKHSDLNESCKYPVIVNYKHWMVTLYIERCHKLSEHSGLTITLSIIRRTIWLIKGRMITKKIIHGCVRCQRYYKKPLTQVTAPLPADRLNAVECFDIVGTDYFGPLTVKNGAERNKVYGLLFTCAVTRAVHLEVTETLTSRDFISAFERFVARNICVEMIFEQAW